MGAQGMKIEPMAWKDKPALIEVAFPAQKISIEAQCERKANAGQTLTALGSYWKGRKPLVLVRACVLGALLPATGDTEKDLETFEMLMAMDDDAFFHRMKKVDVKDVETWGGPLRDEILDESGKWKVRGEDKRRLLSKVVLRMPYNARLDKRSRRPEELPENAYSAIWGQVNAHLGTNARSHVELIEQLGTLRFGHRPRVADAFAGSGSIPFEAARLGCDVFASDVNPIACMLTWGAMHVVGADERTRSRIAEAERHVVESVDAEITRLGIEHDEGGNRAKAYLYCVEARCPESGWIVPLSGSWVISRNRRTVARLVPDPRRKRFDIEVVEGATDADLKVAERGTVRDGHMVYTLDGVERRIPIRTLRGDRREGTATVNALRQWEKEDIVPRADDIFQERLYCVQWIQPGTDSTFFRARTAEDTARDRRIEGIVRDNLARWQGAGLVPDMPIEPGEKTDEPIRTRGWTHWHHLFTPRSLLYNALYGEACQASPSDGDVTGALAFDVCILTDRSARLCRWHVGYPGRPGVAPSADAVEQVFYNQALNVLYNYGAKSFHHLRQSVLANEVKSSPFRVGAVREVRTSPASDWSTDADIFVTDPPYADAVSYDEISEFFIAWLRRNPPAPFRDWVWDSRRDLAIKGSGKDFRREMVKAYTALADHMPENGMQIVMFTHQDAKVWGDMAGIFWAAGLRVTAAWYIATETTSELKKGGYVQGTVILVLRKRTETKKAYKDELVLEVRAEVKRQIETMVGLNQRMRARGRSENLFEDNDLQMAGYAAALRVLTGYTDIDGINMASEALRPRAEGEPTIVEDLIEFAVAIANEELVPDGLDPKVWENLIGAERFYLRMLDLEAAGLKKLDNYQNFAKAFRAGDWQPLMGSMKPNEARLKSARELKGAEFGASEFGGSLLRAVLYALYELESELEADEVMSHLRDNVPGYYTRRADIVAIASYLAGKLERIRDPEAAAARILRDLVKGERLGA
jgi:adenine-specific DNA methylase